MFKEVKNCPVCSNEKIKFLYHTKDRQLGLGGQFSLYKCQNCTVQFLSPQHNYNFLSKYYADNYVPYHRRANDWRDKLEEFIYRGLNGNGLQKYLFYPFEYLIRRALIVKTGQRLLDVGCGSGNYLKVASKLGVECYGLDIYSGKKSFFISDSIKFYNKRVEDSNFPENYFDIITMNHVFEHLADPQQILLLLKKIVKSGGQIIIQVPNNKSFNARIFGRFYLGIDSPRHYFVYNKKSIEVLCHKVGLKVDRIAYRTPFTANTAIFSFIYFLEGVLNSAHPSKVIRGIFGNIIFRILLFPLAIIVGILKFGDGIELFLKK